MDPNANLEAQRLIRKRVQECMCERDCCLSCTHDAIRLADLSEALDEWISKGGFLPSDWTVKNPKSDVVANQNNRGE